MRGRKVGVIALLVTASSAAPFHNNRQTMAAVVKTQKKKLDAPTSIQSKNESPSVLAELKETIRRQAAEIEALKKRLSSSSQKSSAGHHGPPVDEDSAALYSTSGVGYLVRQRLGWLSIFLISLSATTIILSGFEHTLANEIELAFFVPLLAGHGGNTGGQTVGAVLTALCNGSLQLRHAPKVVWKESLSGLSIGAVLGLALALVSHYLLKVSAHVSTVIFFTLPVVSMIASSLASVIPFVCVAMGLDPAVIAAPAMTTLVDVCGLMSYFLIAKYVFDAFGLNL